MNRILLMVFSISIFVGCTSGNNTNHADEENKKAVKDIVIVKEAPFIHLQLNVQAYSADSILAKLTITNNSDSNLEIYKPLLPYNGYTEDLYSILEKTSYERLAFNGVGHESHLNYEDGPSVYIEPKFNSDRFVVLQPKQSLEVESNITHRFEFEKFLKKGHREFKLVYAMEWPYVVNGKQVMEIDSNDHQMKPVYFGASLPENNDPDLMRVDFRIP